MEVDTEEDPTLEHLFEFVAARFEGNGIGPNTVEARDRANERAVVFQDPYVACRIAARM
jgi:hypothetical protein